MNWKHALLGASAIFGAILAAGPASAMPAYATAHLNLRTGPGEQYPVVGMMEYNVRADLKGCLADYTWCSVSVAGINGWASGEYLVMDTAGEIVTVGVNGAQLGVPVVEAEGVELIAAPTPVGAVVAVAPTVGLIEAVAPAPEVITFVKAQAIAPVYVTGEIVVGATLPAAVPLYEVPGSPYQLTVLNGQSVLVEPTARKVVYIVR